MEQKKTALGLIIGTRGIFNAELSRTGRAQLLKQVAKAGCEAVMLPASETPSGAIETVSDGKKCGRFFSENRDRIDGIVVALPNFGDELGVSSVRPSLVSILVNYCKLIGYNGISIYRLQIGKGIFLSPHHPNGQGGGLCTKERRSSPRFCPMLLFTNSESV